MKNYKPVNDFFMRMHSFKPNDIAVLFSLIALQESAEELAQPISPAVVNRLVDITPEECAESISRLISVGEVEWFETEKWGGYLVVRFDEFHESLINTGYRAYGREKQRQSRESKLARKQVVA